MRGLPNIKVIKMSELLGFGEGDPGAAPRCCAWLRGSLGMFVAEGEGQDRAQSADLERTR
jgi:hypothetical protein